MKKWILLTLAALLLGVILFFYIAFNGNFISKMIAKYKVQQYVEEMYEGQNKQMIDSGYNFKDGRYYFIYDIYQEGIGASYNFSIGGPFLPQGRIFSYLDYESTDEVMTTAFQQAGVKWLEEQFREKQLAFDRIDYSVSIPKGLYDEGTSWQPKVDQTLMPSIYIELKDEQQTEEQFLQQAEAIRQLLQEHHFTYVEVNISIMREYDNSDGSKEGYAETYYETLYSTEFTPETKTLEIN